MSGTGSTARDLVTQQTHYLRKRILGSQGNQTVVIGKPPIGANIMRIMTLVRAALTGGTPTVAFGTEASGAAFFAANGAPLTTVGRNNVTLLASALLGHDVDGNITATIAGTPTGGGPVDLEVEFTINNDG